MADLLLPDEVEQPRGGTAALLLPKVADPLASANAREAVTVDPEKFAKAKAIASQLSLPVQTVERNFESLDGEQKVRNAQLRMLADPFYADRMRDPDFAKLSQGDDLSLTGVAKSIAMLPWKATQAVASGVPSLVGGLYGAAAAPFELASQFIGQPLKGRVLPADPFGQVGGALRGASKNLEGYSKRVADVSSDAGVVEAAVASGFQSLGANLPPMVAALYTGNLPAALSIMSSSVGGQSYTKGREAGLSPAQATQFGFTDAAVEYVTERMPLFKLVGDMKAGSPFVKALMQNQVAEQLGEQAATVLQDFNEWATLRPESPFSQYLAERPVAALQTAIATVIGSGGQVAILHAVQSDAMRQEAKAEAEAQAMKELLTNSANSLLRERSPETFTQFVAAATAENPVDAVYVNAAVFLQEAQKAGLDMVTMPETAAALQDAVATGSDVRIPLSEFASAVPGTTMEQSIIPHLKTDPFGATQAEIKDKQWAEDTMRATQKILDQQEFTDKWKQSMRVVKADLLGQLTTANRFTKDVNEAYASFMSAFYSTQAHRLGITPEQMYAKYPLQIRAQEVTGENVLAQPVSVRPRQPDAVSAKGTHFSNVPGLNVLQGNRSGTGIRGAEQQRVKQATDERLKQRVYFYTGDSPRPEPGLGPHRYKAELQNLYDFNTDPRGIIPRIRGITDTAERQNMMESLVIDEGFDGYAAMGMAVVLGGDVPVTPQRSMVNIGLKVGEDGSITPEEALAALKAAGVTVTQSAVHDSDTESTLVAELSRPLSDAEAHQVAVATQQQAIAQNTPDGGKLHGPNAAMWGDFNPRFFLTLDGGRLDESRVMEQSSLARVTRADPAINSFLKNLTPSEQRKVTDSVAARIIEHLEVIPSANEMAAIAFAGRAKRGWYSRSARIISAVFGPDAPRFAMLLAAMSPQTSVQSNLRNTLNTWKNWTAAGRPQEREQIIDIMQDSVEGGGPESVLNAWINNSVRALTDDEPLNAMLSGPKVESFYRNLIGEVDAVTLDTWMANYALVDSAMFAGTMTKTDPGKSSGYLAYSARVREAAKAISKYTGEEWTPAEVQETIWSWSKALYELASRESETAVALLEAGKLTDALISAAPSFDALFNEDEFAAIIQEAGYGEELESAGRDVATVGRQPGEDPRDYGEATPFPPETQRRYERRVARRLDALRKQRDLEQPGARGQITFATDITKVPSVITLLANADLSTFLHESGHFYLEVLADMASQPNAPKEVVDDLNTILAWFGITGNEPVEGAAGGELAQGVFVDLDTLPRETQGDIVAHLTEEVPALKDTDPSEFRSQLIDLVDALVVERKTVPLGSVVVAPSRQISDAAVERYAALTTAAPPILVDGNKLVEGAHRYGAAAARGDKTIDVVDIGPLLRMDWFNWLNADGKLPSDAVRSNILMQGAPERRGNLAARVDFAVQQIAEAEALSKELGQQVMRAQQAGADTTQLAAEWKLAREAVGKRRMDALRARAELEAHRAGTMTQDRNWTRAEADQLLAEHAEKFAAAGFSPRLVGGLVSKTGERKDADIVLDPVGARPYEEAYTAAERLVADMGGKVLGGAVEVFGHEAWYIPAELPDGRYFEFILENKNWPEVFEQGGDAGQKSPLPAGRTPLEVWQNMSMDQRRPYHEQWARGMEAYLFEGKSPSLELQSLFGRFRAWLINVYQQLTRLNVTLTKEVRQVMDRLLATNEEILQAENTRSFAHLFETKPPGMSDADWIEYQKLGLQATQEGVEQLQTRSLRDMQYASRAKAAMLKKLQREASDKRSSVRAEVEGEVLNEPIYRAMHFLKTGKMTTEDGEEIKVEKGHRLDNAALGEMYPPTALANPDLTRLVGMTRDEGLHPDLVAEMFGYGSGDELVRKLVDAEPVRQKIDGLTDQRMLERYGDLADPESMERAANEAVHNEVRGRFVATELRTLDKATGKRGVLIAAAKDYASTLIARKKVRTIRPSIYHAAETKAAKAAERAMLAGDTATAATEKRNQLVNLYAAKAAHSALDEVDAGVAYLKKAGASDALDPSYRDQIETLLERFDLRKVTARDASKRASLSQWIERQRDQNLEPVIDPMLENEAMRKPYQDLTVEEFRGLVDSVRNIEHLGRLKKKLLLAADQRAFDVVVADVAASINANAKRTLPVKLENNTWTDKAKKGVAEFFAMHRKFASILREMDGYADNGILQRLLVHTSNAAGAREAVMHEQATIALTEVMKTLPPGNMTAKTFIPEINASLSREGRIMAVLNMGNAGNMQRLLDGDRWTPLQAQAVLDTLTKEEMDFVQRVWNFVGAYRQEIGAQQKRLTGLEPEWVEPKALVTRHGIYPGGYIPAKYDTTRSTRALSDEAASGLIDSWRAKRGAAKTRDSFTKERASKVVDRPVRKDFGVITQHVTEVTHRLAWQEWLVDANRLFRAGAIDGAIREHYGPETLETLRTALEDIAAGQVPPQNAFERGVNYLRTGATIAGLGWRLTTSLLQPLGLTQSMVRIGPAWVARGVMEWLGDVTQMENTAKRIYEKSDMMRLRGKTMQREISEIRDQVQGRNSAIEASFFYLIQKMQLVADIPTWLGQYQKAVSLGANEKEAVAQADQAVLDSQGGGQIKDLAAIQRGGPLLKLFTNFYSFFNTTFNMTSEAFGRTRKPSQIPLLAVDFLLLYSVPAVLGELMKAALSDDADEDKLIRSLIAGQLNYLLGTMVGVREVAGVTRTLVGLPGDYSGPASLRVIGELERLGKQIGQGEADEAFWKALNSTAGILFHYPAGQINATADGIVTMAQGRTLHPGALVTGSAR